MNFLGMGPAELILVLIIAVVVLGPGKLPEVARALGKTVRDFRKITDGFQNELRQELDAASSVVKEDIKPLQDVATTISSVKSLDPVSSITASVKEEAKPLQEVADTISSVNNINPDDSVLPDDSFEKEKVELIGETSVSEHEPDDSFTAYYQESQGSAAPESGSTTQSDASVARDDKPLPDSAQDDHPVAFQ